MNVLFKRKRNHGINLITYKIVANQSIYGVDNTLIYICLGHMVHLKKFKLELQNCTVLYKN